MNVSINDAPQVPLHWGGHGIVGRQLHHPRAFFAAWAGATRRGGHDGDDDEDDSGGQNVLGNISFNLGKRTS